MDRLPTKLRDGVPDSPMDRGTLLERYLLLAYHLWLIFSLGYRTTGSFRKALSLVRSLEVRRRSVYGDFPIRKIAKVGRRFFWDLTAPGSPSPAIRPYLQSEINYDLPEVKKSRIRMVYLSITKKCPLACEHCYDWRNHNQKGELSVAELKSVIVKYQEFGTGVFFLEGGEPLVRIRDIYEVLDIARPESDFWIITSGYQLSLAKAQKLRQKGLTGIIVSLDHFAAAEHNRFRGSEQAYEQAMRAVKNANEAGLVTALSLCCTREFTTAGNIRGYMDLAKKMGVSFVQWLEPRAVGRYQGEAVELTNGQQRLLEKSFLAYNSGASFRRHPIILYPAYHQRRVGCFGSGTSYLYIDADGDAHSCPFCQQKTASTLLFTVEDILEMLRFRGCNAFRGAQTLKEASSLTVEQ